jgi:hypothetical protein
MTNVHEMAQLLNDWVNVRVELLTHLHEIPEGSEVSISADPDEEYPELLCLKGDVAKAFRLGIQLSLDEFAELPFVTISSEAPASAGDNLSHLITQPTH